MTPADLPDFDDHEDVRVFDLGQGAKAIIAVHSTFRGPAAGGTRVWRYGDETAAMTDALRLSRGMSYKNAMAELSFGGGKSVIMLPPQAVHRRALFEAFGRAVDSFEGRYIAAEDVGSSVADMQVAATQTRFVSGLPATSGRAGGDPSPWTALGVAGAIEAALAWRGQTLAGRHVAVQGVGAVGSDLVRRLVAGGARVTLADIDGERAEAVAAATGAETALVEGIHQIAADVFAPCALGAGLNEETLPALAADIICGAANNQLASPDIGQALHAGGVLYCPDYLVNAGGIIAIHGEEAGETEAQVDAAVRAIPPRLTDVLQQAARDGLPPEVVADRIARGRMGRAEAAAD